MVLADLGSKIAVAMRKMTQTTVIDQTVMNDMLTEICKPLLQADVNIAQVRAGRSAHRHGRARTADAHAAGGGDGSCRTAGEPGQHAGRRGGVGGADRLGG